jgi:hypothetical protein
MIWLLKAWSVLCNVTGYIIKLFTRYPLQFILVLVCCYAFWQKTRYDEIASDYSKYKSAAEQLAKDKEHENEILRNYAKNTYKQVIEEHKQALISAGLDRKRVEDKLKGSINEISNELNIYRGSIKLRNESTSSIDVSKVAEHTSGATDTKSNCNETLATVVDACKVTDYDYEALYNLYKRQCDIYGCE